MWEIVLPIGNGQIVGKTTDALSSTIAEIVHLTIPSTTCNKTAILNLHLKATPKGTDGLTLLKHSYMFRSVCQ